MASNFLRPSRGNFWDALRKTTQAELIKALYETPGIDPWAIPVAPKTNSVRASFYNRFHGKNYEKPNNINSKSLINNAFDAEFD